MAALAAIGAVPREILYDRMKQSLDRIAPLHHDQTAIIFRQRITPPGGPGDREAAFRPNRFSRRIGVAKCPDGLPLQTAKMNDVDPHASLTQTLERIAQRGPTSHSRFATDLISRSDSALGYPSTIRRTLTPGIILGRAARFTKAVTIP
jgi:hypothetical protein